MKYYGKISDPKDLVTKEYVAENGGKIDTITVNSGSTLPIIDKNVDIPITKSTVGLDNVDNKSEATIKSDLTGSIASGNTNFTTGGDVYSALQNKQDNLPQVTNDYYLHANATTGALEWSEVDVDISSKADKSQLDMVLNTATAYTDAITTLEDLTTFEKYRLCVNNGLLGIEKIIELNSISITHEPNKKVYIPGETLDLTGLEVRANYSDNSTRIVTNYTTVPANGTTLSMGTSSVVINFGGQTATQSIVVSNVAQFEIQDLSWTTHTYQFELGMTFSEWLNSSYNVDNWSVLSGSSYIYNSNFGVMCSEISVPTPVAGSDNIIANNTYYGVLANFGVCLTNGIEMEKYPCKPNQTWEQWVSDPSTSWAGYTISDNKVKNANNRTICIDNMVAIPVDPASEIGFVLGENYPQYYSLGQYAFTVSGSGSGVGDFTFEYEGQTFQEWVASSFNTAGYSININDEVECAGYRLRDPNTGMISRSIDPIQNNTTYMQE